jgi:putative phosphoribosyl transferase
MAAVQRFTDLADAGRHLAGLLDPATLHDPVVLALPRGGVPVAAELARALGLPFDVLVVGKVGHPVQRELGIGAVVEGTERVLLGEAAHWHGITPDLVRDLAVAEHEEVARRVRRYRGDRPLPDVRGRDVVLVDDGLATGVTAEAALHALRERGARRLVLAVGVGATQTLQRLTGAADELIAVISTPDLGAVGAWYDDFTSPTDDEVVALLERSARP